MTDLERARAWLIEHVGNFGADTMYILAALLAEVRAEGRRHGLEALDVMLASMSKVAFEHHDADPNEMWWMGQGQGVEAARVALKDALADKETP